MKKKGFARSFPAEVMLNHIIMLKMLIVPPAFLERIQPANNLKRALMLGLLSILQILFIILKLLFQPC